MPDHLACGNALVEAGDPFLASTGASDAGGTPELKVVRPATPPVKEEKAPSTPWKERHLEPGERATKEFMLTLDRADPMRPLGALFDASMPGELYVSAVLDDQDGLVQAAERTCNVTLLAGDFIVAVNGVTGSAMPVELQTSRRLQLTVQRPEEYEIAITKTGVLGCSITYDANTGTALGIASVLSGPIQDWNMEAKMNGNNWRAVQEGDRIIAVNGTRGHTAHLLEAIQANSDLKLTLSRPSLRSIQ